MYDDTNLIHDFLQAGALGYVLKSDAKQLLLAAIETVAGHKPFFTGMVSETLLLSFLTEGDQSPLTPRERTVVRLIAEGHGNKQIGAILDLSVKTVESHRTAANRKLGVRSTAELVRYAVRNKIVRG